MACRRKRLTASLVMLRTQMRLGGETIREEGSGRTED